MAALAVAVTSFTPIDPRPESGSVRWVMLIGIPCSIVLGLSAKHDRGRAAGLIGAALGGLTLPTLIVMQSVAGKGWGDAVAEK